MPVLGVDFGTSNTVAALRTADGHTRALLFDGVAVLPSGVYLTPAGELLAGRDAQRAARTDPGRFEPHPKRCVDDGQVLLGDAEWPVPRLFAAVLAAVAAEAGRYLGAPPEQILLTHPAQWGERRRSVLAQAAALAGMGTVLLVPEPVAAAAYFTTLPPGPRPAGGAAPQAGPALAVGRSLAIYDLGGGTFDAAVVRRTAAGFDVLAEGGIADLGGRDFDQAIVEHLGRTVATSDPVAWQRLMRPEDAVDRRARGQLYDEVRSAKEMLSRTASADIALPGLDVEVHLTRSEFETLVRPSLARTVECLSRTITSAGLAAADLAGVFLVGGGSRIPLAAQLIHAELRIAPTTLEHPETVVAQGAAGAISPALPPSPIPIPVPRSPVPNSPVAASRLPISAVGDRPGPYPPRPVPPPAGYPPAGYPVPAGRPWYTEPTTIATAVVLVLVIVVSVVLLLVVTR
jgi:molecular chaperone DnaK (HSP70)